MRRRTRLRTTALPRRRDVTKPTRHNPECSTTVALSVSSLPRRTRPSRFTRSNSDARVRRRDFEKENEVGCAMSPIYSLPAIDSLDFLHHSTFGLDRKSTRLNSSHVSISYAVFCLK